MSLVSTYTNASIRGWTAQGSANSNYPWDWKQRLSPSDDGIINAISGDGNYLVTAKGSNPDTIRILKTSSLGSGLWGLQQSLTPDPTLNTQVSSISIDYTGSTIVVGCVFVNGVANGRAYIFTRSGTTWSRQQTLSPGSNTYYGQDVAISQDGNYIAVCNNVYSSTYTNQGIVYVYLKTGSTWALQQTIISPNPALSGEFGISLSFNSTGNILAIGEPGFPVSAIGRTYIFTRSGTTWTQQQMLYPDNGLIGDRFGRFVELDSTGQYCVILNSTTIGQAYVFYYSGGTWTQLFYIKEPSYYYGSLAISDNADTIALGAPQTNGGKGQVLMYRKYGSAWFLVQTILYRDVNYDHGYGYGLAITNNSNNLIISGDGPGGFIEATDSYIASIFT